MRMATMLTDKDVVITSGVQSLVGLKLTLR